MPKPKNTEYILTMFLLEGHDRWRSHVGKDPESFERQSKHESWPKVVNKKVYRIDRLTGDVIFGI
jgi:hypothetical protein